MIEIEDNFFKQQLFLLRLQVMRLTFESMKSDIVKGPKFECDNTFFKINS